MQTKLQNIVLLQSAKRCFYSLIKNFQFTVCFLGGQKVIYKYKDIVFLANYIILNSLLEKMKSQKNLFLWMQSFKKRLGGIK